MSKRVIARIINRSYTHVIVPLIERKYTEDTSDVSLKYLFTPRKESDILVVIFQACCDKGATYNYVRTLKKTPVNRLFIKDDFADGRGSYYLSRSNRHDVEAMTAHLIQRIIQKHGFRKVLYVGSSKGGYAALSFGLQQPNATMIVAAPQYYLADYLDHDKTRSNLEDIIGAGYGITEKEWLNHKLQNIIASDTDFATQKVYIQYSDQEHTYAEHIKDLLHDLYAAHVPVSEDVQHYTEHGELRYYFPDYLVTTIQAIVREEYDSRHK